MAAAFFRRVGQALGVVPPDPPRQAPQAPSTPVTVDNSNRVDNRDVNNINFSPTTNFDLNPQIYTTIDNKITNNAYIDLVDEEYNLAKLRIANHLAVGFISGSAALVMNENPFYYAALGLITSGGKRYVAPYAEGYETAATVAGASVVSTAFGKDPITSAIVLGVGNLAGDMFK